MTSGRDDLLFLLERLEAIAIPEDMQRVADLRSSVAAILARISLVGQVKAGKTALANGLLGKHEILPSDVNPWTSVVTSVHMNVPKPRGHSAVFTFFTREEWDSMVGAGGRMGELAGRADFGSEAEEVRRQIIEMKRKAEARLGHNFEYLLGSHHAYVGYHADLLKRYVCLGDDDETAPEGRFADLTRTADLYLEGADWPLPTVLRDMPGVNDPFLMRESVTLDNLGDSDICVVVLNATQTFTSSDMALMRILLALRKDQIVLFVNRVDELDEPHHDIIEIDAYIRRLLIDYEIAEELPIVFGSAVWAEMAAFGPLARDEDDDQRADFALDRLVTARLAALKGDIARTKAAPGTTESSTMRLHDLSGIHELRRVIEELSAREVVGPQIRDAACEGRDIARRAALVLGRTLRTGTPIRADLDFEALIDRLDEMLKAVNAECDRVTLICLEEMVFKMSEAYYAFTASETRNLENLLAQKGDPRGWGPNAERLRIDLNRCYGAFRTSVKQAVGTLFRQTAADLEAFYADILSDDADLVTLTPPAVPEPGTPIGLMRTTTFDLSTDWLSGWVARRLAPKTFVKRFSDLASVELKSTTDEMRDVHVANFLREARIRLHGFLSEHIETLQGLLALDDDAQRARLREALGVEQKVRERIGTLEQIALALDMLDVDLPGSTR